jgi:ATP-dependent DNA helicase DinG
VATQYFGRSVSNYRLDDLARDAGHLLNAGVIADEDSGIRRVIAHVEDHARAFFAAAGEVAGSLTRQPSDDPRARGARDNRIRLGPDWFADIADHGLALIGALDGLGAAMSLAGGKAEAGSQANEDALAIARRAGELGDDLRFMMAASDSGFVYFIETRGRGVFLRAAPIDVSGILQELLFDRWKAAVLTSATLTVEGSFSYVRGRLGISRAEELAVPSEFDFARQALLYLPRRMPPPRSPDFTDAAAREILHLLRRSEGRAFVLFTSYSVLNGVRSIIEPALAYPLLVQGTAPRSALLREFRTRPNAVLLATSSFWQGVDVVGDQLSCVIIDKLPFASPGDPITSARIEAITADGGEAFGDYQVPLAILTLLQGLGRLIRHRTDRGVLAVLDPRLRTMAYGSRFLNSFPPAPTTSDLSAVERFFASSR